jgi:2-dehydro-3-deoxyphosphooctonate aldolase (KDO 8-P synthase)
MPTASKEIAVGPRLKVGGANPLFLVAGPCVIESGEHALGLARSLKALADRLRVPFIFKASYDKANRSSLSSFRGPGLRQGLEVLKAVKAELGVPVLSDVHEVSQVSKAAEVLDVIQIPAFLCRQTDLILEAAGTGKPLNLKKGQFVAPQDMRHAVDKALSKGNDRIILTERGSSFGYNNLVVDMRSIPIMKAWGFPVVLDATHSVQRPGAQGATSGGDAEFIPTLARAGVAAGVDGVFLEVHDNPPLALSDGANSLKLDDLEPLWAALVRLRGAMEGPRP